MRLQLSKCRIVGNHMSRLKGRVTLHVFCCFGGFCLLLLFSLHFFKFVVASSITISVCSHHPVNGLTLNQRVSTANKLCQTVRSQIRPDFYSGQKSLAWSGSELFDTLIVLPKELFKKVNLVKKSADDKKHALFPNRQSRVKYLHLLVGEKSALVFLWQHNTPVPSAHHC